jgi:MGT family glycosyltransferase
MKILVFSPPFLGHLNILKKMVENNKDIEFKIIITGWNNVTVDGETNIHKSILKETDPALWTFKRVYELLDDCLEITKEYSPDLIIYDFFSLEAYFVGRLLNIPAWASIPSMLGPNDKEDYLKSKLEVSDNQEYLKKLEDKYGIIVKDIEMISDGLYVPEKINLVWSYPEIITKDFMQGRKENTFYFLGNYNLYKKQEKEIIYFSLGTVVMDNLWNQQEETREKLKEFILAVSEGLKDEKVVFVTQGKQVLENYPKNWQIEEKVNQVEFLSRAKIFITHGGSNSFHESVLQKVPMIVIPFFGDQILTGQRVENLKIGINLGTDNSIDTKKSKQFLDKELAQKVILAVRELLDNSKYQTNINNLKLTNDNLTDIIRKQLT